MTVKLGDLSHPKNHDCDHCGARAGEWCVMKGGTVRHGFAKQHSNRLQKADLARGGPMIAGQTVEVVYLADGSYVPKACIVALEELNMEWPGATLSQARAAIVLTVLKSYHKTIRPGRKNRGR